MKLSFGPYFLWLATALSCRAQPDSDLYALMYSRRSWGGSSSAAPVRSSAVPVRSSVASSLLFGNIAEELEQTKGLQTELLAVRKALDTAYSPTTLPDNDASRRAKSAKKYDKKHAKKYAKTSKKEASGELEKCQAELAKHKNEVSYLFIQTASACQVQRSTDGETTSYKVVTDSISEDTYVFSDRPYRIEDTVPTADFSAAWSDTFQTSNPNVGVTLVSKDQPRSVGPLVVVFSDPDYQDNGQLAYNMEQFPNQEGVLSIETIFEGTTLDSAPFESCSFFIDQLVGMSMEGNNQVGQAGNNTETTTPTPTPSASR